MNEAICGLCPHRCQIEEGHTGLCGARANRDGEIVCENYGRITSLALDPIEKKPLRRFYPGSRILSAGSYGCNLRCPFCQNHSISMADGTKARAVLVSPEELTQKAQELVLQGNIGLAFTYNEPLISYEYVRDCAELCRKGGLKTVAVTNGYICEEPLRRLLPLLDAVNIDLKGFSSEFYRKLGGTLEDVKRSISICAEECHLEVTTLIVPGENDSAEEMRRLSGWLASLSPEIPLHVTRFFPYYHMTEKAPTPVETVYTLASIARSSLRFVYEGNC